MKTPSSVNRNAHALDYKSIFCSIISDNPNTSAIQLNLKDMNWESFVETAKKEKLLPLLYYACKQKHIEYLMPASVLSSMHAAYMNNMGRTFYLKRSLAEVLKAFNDQHIKIMLLKGGAHLVEPLYPDINTRVMSDIDIMVLEGDIPQVKQLFQDMGFTCFPDPWGEANKMNFVKGQLNYELHTQPFSDLRIPVLPSEELWAKARQKRYGDSLVYLPSPDDFLYHCIFHELIQHDHLFDIQFANLYEVALIINAFEKHIDLIGLSQRAKRYRLEVHLSFFLRELETFLSSPLPSIKLRGWVDDIVNQFSPFYRRVCQLPALLEKAGHRFFNFSILYESKRKNLNNYYIYYIEPILYSPTDKYLHYYGIPPSLRILSPLIRAVDIVKALSLHIVVRYLWMNEKVQNSLEYYRHLEK